MRSELCRLTHTAKLLVEQLRKLQRGGHDPPAIEAVRQRLAATRLRILELKGNAHTKRINRWTE